MDEKRERCVIEGRVLCYSIVQKFSGEAIRAAIKPRFVVTILIVDTKEQFSVRDTGVTFTTHRVALFAIDSIVKVFGETDVIGKDYRLAIERREIDGDVSFWIGTSL